MVLPAKPERKVEAVQSALAAAEGKPVAEARGAHPRAREPVISPGFVQAASAMAHRQSLEAFDPEGGEFGGWAGIPRETEGQ